MASKYPKITTVFDRKKRASSTHKGTLEIRISHDYKQKFIATGIMLYPNQWKNGKITNCDNLLEISQVLEKLLSDIRKQIYDMLQNGNLDIMKLGNKKQDSIEPFIDFCNQRATIRKYGKKRDTQERYDRFIRLFSAWGKIKTFDDINDEKIIAYDKHLVHKGMRPYSKWNNYHRFLNGFINDAISEGLLQRNPYNWINIDKQKLSLGLDKCLTPNEFKQLKDSPMPTECLERVRDLFVFQTYTCLRYSDLKSFDYNNITTINGMEVYKCTQKKTKKPATIPMLQPALNILSKYKGILPVMSNVKYNAYLKVVAQSAGLNYPISTHWARHTGATILLNEGVDLKIVSRICGHSSLRITEQIYAKLLDETVVKAVDAVKNKL